MNVKELLTKPVTVATSAGVGLAHGLGITWLDPLVSVLLANLSTLFTALSITGFTIAPEVAWLPEETLTTLALVVAGLYVATLLDSLLDKLQTKLQNDDTN
jgi:uncharacterized metal-binding protein